MPFKHSASYSLIVIGGGMGGLMVIFDLLTRLEKLDGHKKIRILLINSDEKPACSQSSSAVAAVRAAVQANGPMAKILLQAFDLAQVFYKRHAPLGMLAGKLVHPCPQDVTSKAYANFCRKYSRPLPLDWQGIPAPFGGQRSILGQSEEAFFFSPAIFLNFLQERVQASKHELNILNQEVSEIVSDERGHCIKTVAGPEFEFSAPVLYLAPGAYAFSILQLLPAGKISCGGYYEISPWPLQKESFAVHDDELQITYRGDTSSLLIGNLNWEMGESASQEDKYELLQKGKNYLQRLGVAWPLQAQVQWREGKRSKGPGRRPILMSGSALENLREGIDSCGKIFYLNGLYKNGFLLPFYFAPMLAEAIKKALINEGLVDKT